MSLFPPLLLVRSRLVNVEILQGVHVNYFDNAELVPPLLKLFDQRPVAMRSIAKTAI